MRRALVAGGAIVAGSVLMLSLAWGLQHAALTSPQLLGRAAPPLAIKAPEGASMRRFSRRRGKWARRWW